MGGDYEDSGAAFCLLGRLRIGDKSRAKAGPLDSEILKMGPRTQSFILLPLSAATPEPSVFIVGKDS